MRILQLAIICARSAPCGYVRILQLAIICADIRYKFTMNTNIVKPLCCLKTTTKILLCGVWLWLPPLNGHRGDFFFLAVS